jgi:hypothetical protein|eukprot:COSAG02_NODE_4385_length_5421_cov_4.928035_3_plen_149_part_00
MLPLLRSHTLLRPVVGGFIGGCGVAVGGDGSAGATSEVWTQNERGSKWYSAKALAAEPDNKFFWNAFKSTMKTAGHQVGTAEASDVFDFRFNEDFRDIRDTGQKLYRGGEPYELPIGWKRYAVNVKGKYDGGDNTWLRQRGDPGVSCP